MARFRVGLSGFSYKPWQGEGRFYPVGLKASDFLAYYAQRYESVEVDGSWYKTPTQETIDLYLDTVPENFKFSFKLHRRITHMARLQGQDAVEGVEYFLKRVKPLVEAGKLGPILVQLPPNLGFKDDRLKTFLNAIPKSVPDTDLAVQYAVEFRNPSWNTPEISDLLAIHGVAWVASDTDEEDAILQDLAPFQYVRMRKLDYSEADLDRWSAYYSKQVSAGRDVFAFCKHEDEGAPWIWADHLAEKVRN
jgi:uncharacterized protein YecE (DUF72 family)